jgi:hypothetical protein
MISSRLLPITLITSSLILSSASIGRPQPVNNEDIITTLKGCQKNVTNIDCTFNFLNKGASTTIGVIAENDIYHYGSKIVDDNGTTHYAKRVTFNGKTDSFRVFGVIEPDVNYTAKITFENVGDMKHAQMVTCLYNGRTSGYDVKFKNITIK